MLDKTARRPTSASSCSPTLLRVRVVSGVPEWIVGVFVSTMVYVTTGGQTPLHEHGIDAFY